jgi:hypothetical protein
MYLDLLNGNIGYLHKYLWKMKVPLKIKILMWFVHRKEILTKDNWLKEIGKGAQNVVSVIKRKPFNICSSGVPLQKLFGQLFIWCLILHHLSI